MQRLLEKMETIRPVPENIECIGKVGTVTLKNVVPNPEYPPHRKGECRADDYGMWLYEEMPKILAHIHSQAKRIEELEKALRTVQTILWDKPATNPLPTTSREMAAYMFIDKILSPPSL